MEHIIGVIFIIGIVALIATVIKYPKDVARGILATLLLPFKRIWDFVRLILFPFELLILFIEDKLGVIYLTKLINREASGTKQKTKERKQVNFQNFKKYIVVNSTSKQIEDELKEADEYCPEVNTERLNTSRTNKYSVIETPENGFYGYNFLIQWLTDNLKGHEIVGFASNGRTKFITISNTNGDNDLIGRTNTGKKFWVSLYDDLDDKQFLRFNDELEMDSNLTTESLEKMVKNAI